MPPEGSDAHDVLRIIGKAHVERLVPAVLVEHLSFLQGTGHEHVDRRRMGGKLGRQFLGELAFLQLFDPDPDASSFFKTWDGGLQQIAVRMVSQQDANLLGLSQGAR